MKVGQADVPSPILEQITSLQENQLSLDFGNQDCMESDPGYGAVPLTTSSIDWGALHVNDTLTISNLGSWLHDADHNLNVNTSSKITLTGDDADIEINGESIIGVLKEIRDRLGMIQVSEAMEAEWDELRALRQQYEKKLAECREKSEAWNLLKSHQ